MTLVKICGLTEPETLQTAIDAGADFIGFVFYPPSPRNISPQTAAELCALVPAHIKHVGLFVDPSDEELNETLKTVPLDSIQLHGSETPERVKEISEKFDLPLIKAIRVGSKSDLANIESYEPYIDWFIFDAKPVDATLPGGTGQTFDWSLLEGIALDTPWMLSGGLTPENVSGALSHLNPPGVDVSSGVEGQKGIKDAEKITRFINEVKTSG